MIAEMVDNGKTLFDIFQERCKKTPNWNYLGKREALGIFKDPATGIESKSIC
jgi:hypothetical protein